jgi:molybdopterin-guanine dinucleotide biosynthesis protein A
MKNLLGVILCGGESKRMGTDKGLMPVQLTIRAKFMAEKLSFVKCPVIFSINKKQFNSYSHQILSPDLVIDDNTINGPARGLLSVHNRFPHCNLLLIACDMLTLDRHTIEGLIQAFERENSYDFYVYQDQDFAQPFCGIYTAKGLAAGKLQQFSQQVSNTSMQYLLNSGFTKRLTIENKNAFLNFNDKSSDVM